MCPVWTAAKYQYILSVKLGVLSAKCVQLCSILMIINSLIFEPQTEANFRFIRFIIFTQ